MWSKNNFFFCFSFHSFCVRDAKIFFHLWTLKPYVIFTQTPMIFTLFLPYPLGRWNPKKMSINWEEIRNFSHSENYFNWTLMTFPSHSFSFIGPAALLSSESWSSDDVWLWQALMQTRGMRKSFFLDSNFAAKQGNAKGKFKFFCNSVFFADWRKKFFMKLWPCDAVRWVSLTNLMGFYCVTFSLASLSHQCTCNGNMDQRIQSIVGKKTLLRFCGLHFM